MAEAPWFLNRTEHARILRQIEHRPPPAEVSVQGPCWCWTGALTPNGYGKYGIQGKRVRVVHRIVWEAYNGKEVPPGLQLDHLCHTPSCCNPVHLEPVTPSENTNRQRHSNRGKTHCPNGHEYTPENTTESGGRRWCRECRAQKRRART